MTEKLQQAFKDYFNTPGIELPDPIPAQGELRGGLWVVKYMSATSPSGEAFVDFFAQNRQTNSRHERVTASGEVHALESYQEALIFENENDQDWGKASAKMEAQNKKVTEILTKKGLLP